MAVLREVRCSTDGEPGGNGRGSAGHSLSTAASACSGHGFPPRSVPIAHSELSIPRRVEASADGSWWGYKPRPDLMALYGADGRLYVLFDSDREYDLIVPAAPDEQPITDSDIARARLEDFDHGEGGHVYFIGGDVGAIKIGRSVNVAVRLKDIQACSPIPVRVMATRKGASRERLYHAMFASFRLHGEWFDRVPEILAEIGRLNGCSA